MAKKKFVALYAIGSIAAGQTIELDPDSREAARLFKAKAIADPAELKKQHPAIADDTAALKKELDAANAKIAELSGVIDELQEQLKEQAEADKAEPAKKGGK